MADHVGDPDPILDDPELSNFEMEFLKLLAVYPIWHKLVQHLKRESAIAFAKFERLGLIYRASNGNWTTTHEGQRIAGFMPPKESK